jgi:hypothetical protein
MPVKPPACAGGFFVRVHTRIKPHTWHYVSKYFSSWCRKVFSYKAFVVIEGFRATVNLMAFNPVTTAQSRTLLIRKPFPATKYFITLAS